MRGVIQVALVGCGGSGSQMLTALARLHLSLLALGHPGGLKVTVYDPDRVSDANVGRQLFSFADVGQFKAVVLTHRLNCYYGLQWHASPHRYETADSHDDLLIGCVDTKKARRQIVKHVERAAGGYRSMYYLDLGNSADAGQVFLGEIGKAKRRLPHVLEKFPGFGKGKDDPAVPSCSLAASLKAQSLFINQAVVTFGANLLYQLFTEGVIDNQGFFINLRNGRVRPIPATEIEEKEAA